MKSKKTLAILLAVMMIVSSIPMFASAATALKATNVTEWPTATGEIFYGQMVSEGITISGGKVEYNGVEVPGKFVHWKDTFRPLNASDAYKANLTFVPDDTTTYTGFNKLVSADVTMKVKKTTPVFVDENDLPIATSLASGQTLSMSTISGGTMYNPYNENETAVKNAIWQWTNPDTVITESGEYEAYYTASEKSYEKITRNIYVEVEGVDTTVYGAVNSWPTIECPEWTKGMTVADLTLKGGEATVEGTFAITTDATTLLKPNKENSITVKFTPADSEVEMTTATASTIKITPTFTRKDITVVSISPITIEYGKRLNQMSGTAKNYGVVTTPDNAFLSFNLQENKDAGVYDVALAPGNYTVKGYVNIPSEYISGVGNVTLYNPTTVDIPLVVTKTTSTTKFGSVGSQEIVQEDGSVNMSIDYRYEPEDGKYGHAVLKVNGETVVDNITDTAATEYYSYNVRESGTYTVTLEYVPAENDYIEFTETVLSKTVDITVDLVEEDPIIPILPGGDSDGDGSGITLPEIDLGDLELDTDGDHKFKFVNIIQNLIEMLKNFIKQIGQTIEGIL